MPSTLFVSFAFYAFVSGITPGPANLCSLSSALRYGRKVALRQWTGIFTGYMVVSLVSAVLCYLIGSVMGEYVQYFSFVGALYLLYLAFKMLKSTMSDEDNAKENCNFFTGLFVQLTNVKIMIFCVTTFSIYVLPYTTSLAALLSLAVVLPFIGPGCNMVWLLLGDALRRFFKKWQKQVNVVMALSLVLCAVSLFLH